MRRGDLEGTVLQGKGAHKRAVLALTRVAGRAWCGMGSEVAGFR